VTANEDLFDWATRQRLALLRMEGGVVKRVLQHYALGLEPAILWLEAAGRKLRSGQALTAGDLQQLAHTRVLVTVRLREAHEAIRSELRHALTTAAEVEGARTVAALARALPTALARDVVAPALVDLVAAALEPVGGLRWTDRLAVDLFEAGEAIQATLTGAVVEGLSVPRIADALRAATGIRETYRGRMVAIARTEIQRVSNHAALTTYQANDDVVKGVQWLATLDSRTCLLCAPLHNRTWAFVGPGGQLPPEAMVPPRHPRCRCFLVAVTRSWSELGIGRDPDLDGKPAGDTTFSAWLRRQPADVQRDVLGPARLELWESGRHSLDSFSDARGILTLDEFRAEHPSA